MDTCTESNNELANPDSTALAATKTRAHTFNEPAGPDNEFGILVFWHNNTEKGILRFCDLNWGIYIV